MKRHPAIFMLMVWAGALAAFTILPFQLESRVFTLYGAVVLLLFIATFCGGALLASRPMPQQPRRHDIFADFTRVDRLLMVAAIAASAFFLIDVLRTNLLDLNAAYADRSNRAAAVIYGQESTSSLIFQIGFLLYPASYIYIVRLIGFSRRISLLRLGAFGLMPGLLASLAMGGRSPIAFSIIMTALSLSVRRQAVSTGPRSRAKGNWPLIIATVLVGLVAMNYFAQVFLIRAGEGGADAAFDNAALNWGVSFDGRLGPILRATLGTGNTYLLFVFIWYLVQGIVMSNEIFSAYTGPPHLGIYGFELLTALMRRLNGDLVADRLLRLLDINIIGFLPSAFGSLYVDFKFVGLGLAGLWGYWTGIAYRRVRLGRDPRWLLVAPFVTLGIFFSLINTPLGFSNGFVTHAWLVVAFFMTRLRREVPAAAPIVAGQPLPA